MVWIAYAGIKFRKRTASGEIEHLAAGESTQQTALPQPEMDSGLHQDSRSATCFGTSELGFLLTMRTLWNVLIITGLAATGALAQEIAIQTPPGPPVIGSLLRPFHIEKRVVSPAQLTNTPRLESLIRAGNLYLSAQDVIALALENNVDIAIQRYGPYLAREVVRRAQGGGALRDISQPVSPGPTSVSLEGVSVNAVGLQENSGVGSGGGIVIQTGTQPPNLDPVLSIYTNFQHSTTPESNIFVVSVPSLLADTRQASVQYSQSFVTGTYAQLTYSSVRSNYNSPDFDINPSTN